MCVEGSFVCDRMASCPSVLGTEKVPGMQDFSANTQGAPGKLGRVDHSSS